MPITDHVLVVFGYSDVYGQNRDSRDVVEGLKQYGTWAILITASKLALTLSKRNSKSPKEQIELLKAFFSLDTRKTITSLLKSRQKEGRGDWVFFAEPPLLTLVSLALIECDRKGGKDVTGASLEEYGKWLMILTEEWTRTGMAPPFATDTYRMEGLRRYFARQYFLDQNYNLLHSIARTWLMIEHSRNYQNRLDIEGMFEELTGVSVQDYICFAFSLLVKWKVYDGDIDLNYDVVRDRGYFREMNIQSDVLEKLLGLFTLETSAFEAENSAVVRDILRGKNYQNNFMVFMRRPLISGPQGKFICISPDLLARRATDGVYWLMNERLISNKDKRADRLPEVWGLSYEGYINERLKNGFGNQYLSNFGIKNSEKADGLVLGRKALFIIEIKYAHWSYRAKLTASRSDMQSVLNQILGTKNKKKGLGQVASTIREILNGSLSVPGCTSPQVIVPIVIVGDGMPLEPLNRRYYEGFAACRGSIVADKRVMPFILLETEEIEYLEAIAVKDSGEAEDLLLEYANSFVRKNNAGLTTEVASFKNFLYQRGYELENSESLRIKFDEIMENLRKVHFPKETQPFN